MFIDADLRANIVARFELVGTEETPVAGHAGRARRGRSSALRELVRLIYERTKFSPAAFADERSAVSVPSPKSIPRQTRSSTDRSAPSGLYEGSSRPGSAAEPAGDRPLTCPESSWPCTDRRRSLSSPGHPW